MAEISNDVVTPRLLFEKRKCIHKLTVGQLIGIIENKRYDVEYQSIICIDFGEIVAYEGLARFYLADASALSPYMMFDSLKDGLKCLRQVDRELKSIQTGSSCH